MSDLDRATVARCGAHVVTKDWLGHLRFHQSCAGLSVIQPSLSDGDKDGQEECVTPPDAQRLEHVPLADYDLVLADPPYSVEDCERYQTTMVKRNTVMGALAGLSPGAHVVWLDQVLPMYRKDTFSIEAVIGMVKSTNHRFRVVTIFKRCTSRCAPAAWHHSTSG